MSYITKAKSKLGDYGFTLVELMAVVAIIGILSMVAVPNFQKYQVKARKSEAKTQLSSLFMAEAGFYADYDNYAACLALMGFNPGPASGRFYAVGFQNSSSAAAERADENAGGPSYTKCRNDIVADGGENHYYFPAGKTAGGTAAIATLTSANHAVRTADNIGQYYKAGALGNVGAGAGNSNNTFTITQSKILTEADASTAPGDEEIAAAGTD